MTQPVLSIVTISYNQAEFLRRTIDSVLEQRGVDFEYIVCDPGSTDGSRDIIDSYGDAIATRIYEKDKGPADGLNRGFAAAKGRIFAYLNSDDTVLPDAFRKAVEYLEYRPRTDVVMGHALVTDRNDRILRRVWSEGFSRRMFAYGASVQIQPSTYFRANTFRRVGGFNINNWLTWDAELLVDMHLDGAKIAVIDAWMSTYRLHSTSITNSGGDAELRQADADRYFLKLMGREIKPHDRRLANLFRLWKHVKQPRAMAERLLKGPVYMRGVS